MLAAGTTAPVIQGSLADFDKSVAQQYILIKRIMDKK